MLPCTYSSMPGQIALQAKEMAISRHETAEMHNKDGLALFASGKYDEAIRHYNEAGKSIRIMLKLTTTVV